MKLAIIGGHFTPALAVIESLPGTDSVIFFGRKHTFDHDPAYSLEYTTITQLNIPFYDISAPRIRRFSAFSVLLAVWQLPVCILRSLYILYHDKPDAVLGFGGYVSVPVALAAYILKIPVFIHEQTLLRGLANYLISFFAVKVFVSWPSSARMYPAGRTVLTGNPLRDFPKAPESSRHFSKYPVIYITGGSAGAHNINSLVKSSIEKLLDKCIIIHQTGNASEYKDFDQLYRIRSTMSHKQKERYILIKFIDPKDTGSIYRQSDLIVGRCGINTVTEILYFGKVCLCIPLEYGQKNEQLNNARFVKKIGIGDYMREKDITPDKFFAKIESMLDNHSRYSVHRKYARTLIHTDAARRIIDIVHENISAQDKKKIRP